MIKTTTDQRLAYIEKQMKSWPDWKRNVGSYCCKDTTITKKKQELNTTPKK